MKPRNCAKLPKVHEISQTEQGTVPETITRITLSAKLLSCNLIIWIIKAEKNCSSQRNTWVNYSETSLLWKRLKNKIKNHHQPLVGLRSVSYSLSVCNVANPIDLIPSTLYKHLISLLHAFLYSLLIESAPELLAPSLKMDSKHINKKICFVKFMII